MLAKRYGQSEGRYKKEKKKSSLCWPYSDYYCSRLGIFVISRASGQLSSQNRERFPDVFSRDDIRCYPGRYILMNLGCYLFSRVLSGAPSVWPCTGDGAVPAERVVLGDLPTPCFRTGQPRGRHAVAKMAVESVQRIMWDRSCFVCIFTGSHSETCLQIGRLSMHNSIQSMGSTHSHLDKVQLNTKGRSISYLSAKGTTKVDD